VHPRLRVRWKEPGGLNRPLVPKAAGDSDIRVARSQSLAWTRL